MKMTKEEKLNLYKFVRAKVEADFNATGKEWIYIYFKDCFYLLIDENMHKLLLEKVGSHL